MAGAELAEFLIDKTEELETKLWQCHSLADKFQEQVKARCVEVDRLIAHNASLKKETEEAKREAQHYHLSFNEALGRISTLQRRNADLEHQVAHLQKEIEEQSKRVAEHLAKEKKNLRANAIAWSMH
jgi:predicted RNase H-like nuclease (RuvC/YqgF family)